MGPAFATDFKDKWNLKRRRANSSVVIKHTFLTKGKSVDLEPYLTVENSKKFSDLLLNSAVEGKTNYPHLIVLPDLDNRNFGDKTVEDIRYNFTADLKMYIHTRMCKRRVLYG